MAANTWLCNATNETLYLTVRHYAPSIFVQNARTVGWHRLPTRGVLRSCWVVNRTLRDHIVVVGVERDGEIVPILLTPRNADRRRSRYICVPIAAKSFEYRSQNRSDTSCRSGYQRAQASFSVEGGENDVDINLSGPIRVPASPEPQTQGGGESSRQPTETTRQENLRILNNLTRMPTSEYFSTVSREAPQDYRSSVENWTQYLAGTILRVRDEESEYTEWIALAHSIIIRDFDPQALVMVTDNSDMPPEILVEWLKKDRQLQAAWADEDQDSREAFDEFVLFFTRTFRHTFSSIPEAVDQFDEATNGRLTEQLASSRWDSRPRVSNEIDAVVTQWMVVYLPETTNSFVANDPFVPHLCFRGPSREMPPAIAYSCYRMTYNRDDNDGAGSVDLFGPVTPNDPVSTSWSHPTYEDVIIRP